MRLTPISSVMDCADPAMSNEDAPSATVANEPRRPAFARDFPRDASLDALVRAFEEGNFARVRAEAPALARSTNDPAIKQAAETLRARIEPDPLARLMLVLTGVLLAVLSAWWIWHDGPGH